MPKVIDFFVRQLTRLQYGLSKFSIFFSAANFISLILLVLTNLGLAIKYWHLAVIYVSLLLGGILLALIIEKFGGWHIDKRQQFNMITRNLFKDQQVYNSLMIAKAMRLTDEELDKELSAIRTKLFEN